MKKILIVLLVVGCSEDNGPVFKIEDTSLQSRFDKFVEIATNLDVTVPRNNMILRFIEDDNDGINDSKTHTEGGQLYIDIDKGFIDLYPSDIYINVLIYQQLAHGLLNTPFREDCGMMKRITVPADIPEFNSLDYGDYPALFDPQAPC